MAKKDGTFGYTPSRNDKKEKAIAAIKTVFKDVNTLQQIVSASLFDSDIDSLTQGSLEMARLIVSKADKGVLILQPVQLVTESILELSMLILKAKAANPLISDDLVNAVTKTATDANEALKLTEEALE